MQQQQFRPEHFPEMAVLPQEAIHRMVRNEVDYLPMDKVEGRVSGTLALVYPPGIGVIVPGERYDANGNPTGTLNDACGRDYSG
jgi:ornithine decarboxylase